MSDARRGSTNIGSIELHVGRLRLSGWAALLTAWAAYFALIVIPFAVLGFALGRASCVP